MLFDGPSARACLFGRWQELPSNAPFEPVSGPAGLRFLNLMLPETIIEAMEGGEDEVRSEPATRYRLKLDVDRMQWPTPEHSAVTPRGLPLVGRLLSKALPDPRPQGILSAEVWLDDAGRLVRFSHNDLPTDHPKHRQALWTTTELWDFGIPPPLSNWKTQPVIDPMTLQFPQTEAEFMHLARPKPDTPDR
jgi:hypothetical protein